MTWSTAARAFGSACDTRSSSPPSGLCLCLSDLLGWMKCVNNLGHGMVLAHFSTAHGVLRARRNSA